MRESETTGLTLATPEAMREFGTRLGDALLQGLDTPQCVFLEGELGAGKTTLVGGILSAFGIPGPARSPTYTLIEPYEANGRQLYHIDLYRLAEPEEIEPLGLRDLLVPGAVLLIEWPSRAPGRLPTCDLRVCIEYAEPLEAGRHLTLESGTCRSAERLRRLLL